MMEQFYVIKYFSFTKGESDSVVYCKASSVMDALKWFYDEYEPDICEFLSITQIFIKEVN